MSELAELDDCLEQVQIHLYTAISTEKATRAGTYNEDTENQSTNKHIAKAKPMTESGEEKRPPEKGVASPLEPLVAYSEANRSTSRRESSLPPPPPRKNEIPKNYEDMALLKAQNSRYEVVIKTQREVIAEHVAVEMKLRKVIQKQQVKRKQFIYPFRYIIIMPP